MTKNRYIHSLFLVLTSIWLGWTILVDMFIIRTVFSVISDFFQAGDLGIAVFAKLNSLEVIVSSFLVAILTWNFLKIKKSLLLFILGICSWMIVMFYFSFLTPKLITLTELWKSADLMGINSVAGIPDIQQEHQFYHNLYIGLDVIKVAILSAMTGLGIWKEKDWV